MNLSEYKTKYEKESLVAFLDILGFKEMVKRGMQEKILEFLYLIRELNVELGFPTATAILIIHVSEAFSSIIVTNAFHKKTDKLPPKEKERALKIKENYESRISSGDYYE